MAANMTVDDAIEKFIRDGYEADLEPHFNLGDTLENDYRVTIRVFGQRIECQFIVFLTAEEDQEGQWRVGARTAGVAYSVGLLPTLPRAVDAAQMLLVDYDPQDVDWIEAQLISAGFAVEVTEFDCIPWLWVQHGDAAPGTKPRACLNFVGGAYMLSGFYAETKPTYKFSTENIDAALGAILAFFSETDAAQ